ncbi:deoxyribose-phosphate aldolase [Candidatus Bipolaricaulota bacterium]|jgi:deoxyribose-phosphate aldolase|nr:deoxyribose-phosphate aldolase [Candidatus Bipolaricaulota bacterium]TFH08088.1 MAG: deoxyribose-phosphate aldolase [Candidatus Atribacteria bacterium]
MLSKSKLAGRIDHTLLGQTASKQGIKALCEEAVLHGVASVCVNPCHAALAKSYLADSNVLLCVVVGFPHGMSTKETKAFEAQQAIGDGADELDMVINVAALKEGDFATVEDDIRAVCAAAEKAPTPVHVKVILETALLTDEEKVAGAILAKSAGAHYVKTSTGFASGGATLEDVALLRKTVGTEMGVKAAGGIRDATIAQAMIEAGASRIGASRTVEILGSIE